MIRKHGLYSGIIFVCSLLISLAGVSMAFA